MESLHMPAKCMQMCPASECIKREKNQLIHVLETNSSDTCEKRKGDPEQMIKSYTRSAAGQMLSNPELLRPVPVLLQTIEHLLTKIIEDNRVPPLTRYDFINDRLRSVKQDGVIQRLSSQDWCRILPSLVRFYALSAYWHCEERAENFDQKLNRDRLVDCLLLFIENYETLDEKEFGETVAEMEALHLIVDNDHVETINRAVLLNLRKPVFQDTLKLVLDWHRKKYVSVIRLLMKLPLLPACLFVGLCLNKVRKQTLQIMCHAYSCKNAKYPLDRLKEHLVFNSLKEVIDECVFYKISVFPENNTVQFQKMFLRNEIAPSRKLRKLNERLNEKPTPSLLLNDGGTKRPPK